MAIRVHFVESVLKDIPKTQRVIAFSALKLQPLALQPSLSWAFLCSRLFSFTGMGWRCPIRASGCVALHVYPGS
jgi:hypothetical protein